MEVARPLAVWVEPNEAELTDPMTVEVRFEASRAIGHCTWTVDVSDSNSKFLGDF
jgi:hypothetical protein